MTRICDNSEPTEHAFASTTDADAAASIDAELDEALMQTFPASDPVTITPASARRGEPA